MSKFKEGDKVRRVAGEHLGMLIGDTDVVMAVFGDSVVLKRWSGAHVDYNLELVVEDATKVGEFDPNGLDQHSPGAKVDAGKLRPTLVINGMSRALLAVIKVATDGAAKYTDGGWVLVPNGEARYADAELRHLLYRASGQTNDKDSGSLHLAHEAWNALAKLDLYLREQEKDSNV